MMTFAARTCTGCTSGVIHLRTERGLTQGRLAAPVVSEAELKASLYTAQVSSYERGYYRPRGKALAQLAAALDVDVSELIAASE
jgi:transcriptional regulator with XRE-family HTH domain